MTEREQIEKEIEEYEKRRAGLISDDRSLHELEGRIGGLLLCITELASVLPQISARHSSSIYGKPRTILEPRT